MNNDNIIYFEYARKSTEGEDRQVLSIDGQLKDNSLVIARNNLLVVATITDTASAAIPYNRAGFTDMIRRIKKGEASGIVVWNIDRLVRNSLEEGEFKWMLQTGVIKSIWTPNREYRSEDNVLLISIETSMATQYSRDLSVKVKRGNKQKYEMGQPLCIAPLGYLNTKFQIHGTNYLIEDPERFYVMQKGFQLLLTGKYTVPQVVSILHEYGLQTRGSKRFKKGPVSLSTMYRVFTDELYAGYFVRSGNRYKGSYRPMITLDEFDKIQFILGRKGKAKPHKHEFAFTGFIKCGSCGCAITASKKLKLIKSTGEYKTYVFYHCSKRKGGAACSDKKYTTEIEMEKLIERELSKCSVHVKFKEWAIKTVKSDEDREISKRNLLLNNIKNHEEKIIKELDVILDMRISNNITETVFVQKKSERESLLLRIKERRVLIENSIDDWIAQFAEVFDFAHECVNKFKNGDTHSQKIICNNLGSHWILHQNKLTFTRHNWILSLENLKSHYEKENNGFAPIKTYEEYVKSPSYMVGVTIVRRLRDQIRTEKSNKTVDGTLSKHFPHQL